MRLRMTVLLLRPRCKPKPRKIQSRQIWPGNERILPPPRDVCSVFAAEQNDLDTEIFDIRPSAIRRDRLAINLLGKGQAGSVSKG